MSTNIVHVLTVIGKAANEVEAVCEELLGSRVERRAGEFGTDDWSEQHHKEIREFCQSLIGAAHELPIHYYAQYLDGWSVADSRFMLLEWPDGKRRQVFGTEHGVAFYPSDCCKSLLAQIAKWRRRKIYRTQTEDRWYLDHVKEAIQAAIWLESPFLVISISECLGASRLDEEIKASLETSIELLKPRNRISLVARGSRAVDLDEIRSVE